MAFKSPKEIALSACSIGKTKSETGIAKLLVLGFLAGAYIAFGGFLAIMVGKGVSADLGPGIGKLLFGGVFPVGLMLVVIAGSELFTGNCGVITPSCLRGSARWMGLLKNWIFVYIGNFIGSLVVAYFLAYLTGLTEAEPYLSATKGIAEGKIALSFGEAFFRGVGCNWLVCLAVWMAVSAEDIAGKILAIWWPIMAFVALGFEHSVANMFFIPLGMFNGANVSVGEFLINNLLPVTLGNIVGGAGFVGAIYWWLYGRE
ncbi:MAG: formate/nitrite transporter family protein [Chloroflexia bacterium]|nr:formate/nitrite transporter family protein [Chloroflexia bacterium]